VVTAFVVVVLAVAAFAVKEARKPGHLLAGPPCKVTVAAVSYSLDLEQAANATTIAAVGKRLGLADHAVTIALAAALQESKLHNVDYGDLDSVGLFQQRPSQGWGTRQQILVPRYAAEVFYRHLAAVDGWTTMAVTTAAQAVQHSAAPDAYAQWEGEARVLAVALTGETPTGLTCNFKPAKGPILTPQLDLAMSAELGAPNTGAAVSDPRGWLVANWLVGHAQQFDVKVVTFQGWRWVPGAKGWLPDPAAGASVTVAMGADPRSSAGSSPQVS
jgi:hypothetical protein